MSYLEEVNADMLQEFLYFINERHSIFERRLSDTPFCLWTEDSVLKKARFCNVFRMLDRGSQISIDYMNRISSGSYSELDELTFAFAYRKTNNKAGWSEAISMLGIPDHSNISDWVVEATSIGIELKDQSPYHVCCGVPKGETIISALSKQLSSRLKDGSFDRVIEQKTFDDKIDAMLRFERVGRFTAQQILTDYGYGRSGNKQCENDGVVAGPGSLRGLSLLFGFRKTIGDTSPDMIKELRSYVVSLESHPVLSVGRFTHDPSYMDIQNCLCEFDKYVRFKRGGRPKRGYKETSIKPIEDIKIPISWQ